MGMRRPFAALGLALCGALMSAQAWAEDIGVPKDKAIGLQPGYSELKHDAIFFHDMILMPIITVITLFVLGLLLWIIVRYNKRANPTPARWSHNTLVEVIWTVVPVLILMFIAIFSFKLLYKYHTPDAKPYMTVKVTGYQWYWGYEYPDAKVAEQISNLLPENKAPPGMYRLAADNPMVVPVNRPIKVLVTGSDVIHAFAMPAFGLKTDAIPGRVNETKFTAEKIGTYYGQCSELCGTDHAFMPIMIKVVSDADFATWVAAHKGTMPGTAPAPVAAAVVPAAAAPGKPNAGSTTEQIVTGTVSGDLSKAQAKAPAAQAPASTAAPASAAAPAAKK
jgi:cytochrome c oxidase subunit 2